MPMDMCEELRYGNDGFPHFSTIFYRLFLTPHTLIHTTEYSRYNGSTVWDACFRAAGECFWLQLVVHRWEFEQSQQEINSNKIKKSVCLLVSSSTHTPHVHVCSQVVAFFFYFSSLTTIISISCCKINNSLLLYGTTKTSKIAHKTKKSYRIY